ncbi:conserved protein of unknown function [Pseudomonas marincola]|uniref:Uncharacterized protein n=1 Tax=Pseudomonas marincola TaxID=437900 RepID=A0A653DZ24_9PSED|nr:conserved protein of unknown function [Pseudomonas marincola]
MDELTPAPALSVQGADADTVLTALAVGRFFAQNSAAARTPDEVVPSSSRVAKLSCALFGILLVSVCVTP